MTTYDLTPLFRTSVGFDRINRLMDAAMQMEGTAKGYPPYNIVKRDTDLYRITLAVAGFAEADLHIQLHNNQLTITGNTDNPGDADTVEYLYKGIAGRAFERRFQLADHIKVVGAGLENGLLHVELERDVPEALRPRTIPIGTAKSKAIEAAK